MLAPRTIIRHSIAAELINFGLQGDAVFVTRTAQFGDGDPYPNLAIYTLRESSKDRKGTGNGEQEITLTIEARVRREADRPSEAQAPQGQPSQDGIAYPADVDLDTLCSAVEAVVVQWAKRKTITSPEGDKLRILGLNSVNTEIDVFGQSELPYLLAVMSFELGYEPCYEDEQREFCRLKEAIGSIKLSSPCIPNLGQVSARYAAKN